jgi:hypothetical protein
MGGRLALVAAVCALAAGTAAAQPISSPRGSSGTPLAETFTPDSLFPKKAEPPPVVLPPPVLPGQDGPPGPDGGLLPPKPVPPPKYWSGGADLGLNGATGNSDLVNVRGGWNVRRRSERNSLTSDFQYIYSQQNGSLRTHQALLNSRDEILFPGTRWLAFGASQIEYDQLRSYRFRVGTYLGTGYSVVDQPDLVFKVRAGAGATREFGVEGVQDRWVPEMLYGYDFRYKMNERSTFVSIVDIYPRLDALGQLRARARAAYEYVLDPKTGAVMRLGIQERYDSDPGTAKRNDLNYFVTFGFKF